VTSADVAGAYDLSADAWVGGPELVYTELAAALVAASPVGLRAARVLDVGAGTGVASRLARAGGAAKVVGIDISARMVAASRDAYDAVLADAVAMPFGTASFDLVIAACCLGHLPDPARAVREARRVATAIVASAFEPGWTHPAKAAVDAALVPFGYRPPAWYLRFKQHTETLVDDPAGLAALAAAAGYGSVEVRTLHVATGLDTPAGLAAWRLGMAHLAPFIRSLAPAQQARARLAAQAAVVGSPPLVIPLVVLAAT